VLCVVSQYGCTEGTLSFGLTLQRDPFSGWSGKSWCNESCIIINTQNTWQSSGMCLRSTLTARAGLGGLPSWGMQAGSSDSREEVVAAYTQGEWRPLPGRHLA